MPTVKLTADLSGDTVTILAKGVDSDYRSVFATDIDSSITFALFHVHREMRRIAMDLGGVLDSERILTAGTRYVKGVE